MKNVAKLIGFSLITVMNIAQGTVISVGGDVAFISAPASVEAGALESSTNFWTFDEKQSYTLPSDLLVDELLGTSSPGLISAGRTVNSYFVHADPVGNSESPVDAVSLAGTITFDTPILGLIWSGVACEFCPSSLMYLDNSDYLGSPSTNYPTDALGRGLEMDNFYAGNGTQDLITISSDGYSLTTVSSAALPLYSDQLRIITAAIPVPPTLWLVGGGLFALTGMRRLRKL